MKVWWMIEELNSCCGILVTQMRVRVDKKDLKFLLEGPATSSLEFKNVYFWPKLYKIR